MKRFYILLACLFLSGIPSFIFANTIVYVTQNGAGTKDATSWANALDATQLKSALDNAPQGTDFWIAAGTYYPGTSGNTNASFVLNNGVGIYGGFNGTEQNLSERDFRTNVTVLSGDLDQSNSPSSNDAFSVVSAPAGGWNPAFFVTIVIDGLTIRGGNNTTSNSRNGGGLALHTNSSDGLTFIIRNCIVTGNYAGSGGGMQVLGNCQIENCFFSNNTAGYGSGIHLSGFNATVSNCVFVDNHSGSPFVVDGYGYASLVNCSFSGALPSYGLVENLASTATITNCILWTADNTSGSVVGSIAGGSTSVYYSDLKNGWSGTGSNNINVDPLFANSNLELSQCSPAINTGTNTGAPAIDYLGNARPYAGTVDMGAYEYQSQVTGPGDPSVFGDNVWNVYAWNSGGANINNNAWNMSYHGFYVETALSFDTRNRWSENTSPSSASGYQGCPVANDNHSWSAKRNGFPCGYYIINIPGHDDAMQLFINGVKVFEHDGCCDSHDNVWNGDLGPDSKIEFRVTEGGGASYGAINFSYQSTTPTITVNGSTTVCYGSSVTLSSSISSGNQWYKDGVAINGATAQTLAVTASGNYTTQIANSLGCTFTANSITVTVGTTPPPGDPSVFGNNEWNVYAWNAGGAKDIGDSWNSNYSGYYTVDGLNFNSKNQWSELSSPSSASGYLGCPLNDDNHSWAAKRKGFPCAYYRIDIPSHDDQGELWINGKRVWQHIGCCDSHNDVWQGFLGADDEVEFRVTEGSGASLGSISFTIATPTLTGTSLVCNGSATGSVSAPVIEGATYLWSPGGETSSGISNLAASTYSVIISKGGCSAGQSSFTIGQLPLITPTISGITTTCQGSSTTLTAGQTGPIIWNSGSYTFEKTSLGQTDNITPNTHLTRGSSQPIYNAVTESGPITSCSWTPGNTEWAFGDIKDWASLTYLPLWTVLGCSSPASGGSLNQPMVLHLIAENIYLQIRFTYWQSGGGGNFTYVRTTGPTYSWSTGETTPTISVNTSGTYSLTIAQGNGCTATASQNVTVKPLINWYYDNDGDGYGGEFYIASCDDLSGSGYVSGNHSDCDDNNAAVNPNAIEICDGIDNDCDGQIDEGVGTTFYRDADGDGYGNPNLSTLACSAPAGYVSNNTDCDDARASVHPGAAEICDGLDNNCDGRIDEGCLPVTISIADVSMKEGNKGKSTMMFAVTLNKAYNKKVTVQFTTQNGTATAGSDYDAKSGSITFTAGSTKQNISISIIGDKTVEPDETFKVNLSNAVNASIVKGTGTGTILNDDGATAISSTSLQTNNNANERSVKISPNPVSSILRVDLTGFTGNVTMQLVNLQGKVLKQEKMQTGALKYVQQQMNVAGLASGTYFLVVIDEKGKRQTERVIIAR